MRTIVKDGEAWFVAKDVCDILDIVDPSMAVVGSMMMREVRLVFVRQPVRVNC